MKKTERIENLEAEVEHLQFRIDHLRDYLREIEPSNKMNYFWAKFEKLVEISHNYDANSEEYEKINSVALDMFDRYLTALLESPFGGKKDEN